MYQRTVKSDADPILDENYTFKNRKSTILKIVIFVLNKIFYKT